LIINPAAYMAVDRAEDEPELGFRGTQVKWGAALIDGAVGQRMLRSGNPGPRAAEMVGNLYSKGGTLPPNYA